MSPQQVEDCVKALMADPDFKPQEGKTKEESAWAVCQAQYQKTHGNITLEMITEPVNFVVAQEESGEVLRFRNAILVVAETNRNQDTITEEGISEICASLPGRPIDWDHEFTKNVGVFTGAKAIKLEDRWAASTDGIIWADRFPQAAEGVRNGTLHLSIEARAETAECSECGGVFGEVIEYCQHLLNKIQSGANRILRGLKAVGGALTEKPAGTGTTFDQSKVYFVANHQEEEVIDIMDEEQYDEIMGKKLTTKTRKALKSTSFALIQKKDGKTIRRFPIHDCPHARNALARLPNAKGLSSDERATVKRKAQAKLKSKECQGERKGEYKGGSMETLEEVQAQLDQVTKLYDQEVAVKEQAQADLATAQEEKVALQAEVDEKTAELEKVNTSLKEAVTAHRVQILTLSGMDEEQVKEAETTVATMDEAQFNLLLANIKAKPATDKPKGSGGFSPGENDGDKPKLVLSKEV
jgi:hypothetical protein